MKKNIITKQLSKEQADLLLENNIPYECLPVLDFKVDFDIAKAKQMLATPDAVWVFTSVRAVQALSGLMEKAAVPSKIFTVGKNAADELAKLGYITFVADIYGIDKRPASPKEAGKIAGIFKKDIKKYAFPKVIDNYLSSNELSLF